ncbi:methanogenic corrinoid protein MtbC1 [Rhodopseudomonas rhenobacensis]|uniref:Methanogenic corrinoid protein MtbC1 n=1 Tax=Rhodopseudomonas rhenobacensis TaxID=87461 RepID=A0A7W8DWZ9_9BRAD|nr:methanogenic corrinoid protein MtbC1 [Rhodopseudomonas rhenobacensis]
MNIENIVPTIIPRLFVKPSLARVAVSREAHPRAAELARLLLAPQPDDAFRLIDRSLATEKTPAQLFTALFEPAARHLGDLWSADDCSEFEVTIALCHLQSAMRRISVDRMAPPVASAAPLAVLVAPQPGEPHLFCAALNGELLRQAGWATSCEFPDCDLALKDLVARTWFDAIDLSLSPALRREHWLPRLAETVRQTRRASRNPAITIVVSGRVFAERPEIGEQIGADAACESAAQIEALIQRLVLARYAARRPANFAWS